MFFWRFMFGFKLGAVQHALTRQFKVVIRQLPPVFVVIRQLRPFSSVSFRPFSFVFRQLPSVFVSLASVRHFKASASVRFRQFQVGIRQFKVAIFRCRQFTVVIRKFPSVFLKGQKLHQCKKWSGVIERREGAEHVHVRESGPLV